MSSKLIWSACAMIALLFVILLFRDRDQSSLNSDKEPQITRQANRVVMFERKRDNGRVLEISAREVDETTGQVAHLRDFILTQPGELTLSGSEAVYDRARAVLELKGKVLIKKTDGSQAVVDGLVWDRKDDVARTDNPVSYQGSDGFIRADRAEFSDEFTRIAFAGRVHAQIMQNILNP